MTPLGCFFFPPGRTCLFSFEPFFFSGLGFRGRRTVRRGKGVHLPPLLGLRVLKFRLTSPVGIKFRRAARLVRVFVSFYKYFWLIFFLPPPDRGQLRDHLADDVLKALFPTPYRFLPPIFPLTLVSFWTPFFVLVLVTTAVFEPTSSGGDARPSLGPTFS